MWFIYYYTKQLLWGFYTQTTKQHQHNKAIVNNPPTINTTNKMPSIKSSYNHYLPANITTSASLMYSYNNY